MSRSILNRNRFHALLIALLLFIVTSAVYAEPRTLLLLHTNDLHDHVRADYDGNGGMAYVSGYIQQVKQSRDDVLVLDAGDVMEKGDLVAFRAKSTIMYKAISRIGYDAIAPGNHDDAYGDAHLQYCASLAPNTATLALNLMNDEGELLFAPSKIFERNGLKIGVIGVFKPRDEEPNAINNPKQQQQQQAHAALGAPGLKGGIRVGDAALNEWAGARPHHSSRTP